MFVLDDKITFEGRYENVEIGIAEFVALGIVSLAFIVIDYLRR